MGKRRQLQGDVPLAHERLRLSQSRQVLPMTIERAGGAYRLAIGQSGDTKSALGARGPTYIDIHVAGSARGNPLRRISEETLHCPDSL